MSSYKLHYFNLRGRAECSRWLFAYAGVNYEDVRIESAQWAQKKQEMPLQQVPVLDVIDDSGKVIRIPQSNAIERYLAREFRLMGKNNLDSARVEFLTETFMDIIAMLPWKEKDEVKKKQLMAEALAGPIASGLATLENFIQDSGYFVGDSITLMDIKFACGSEFLAMDPTLLDKTPKLKTLRERVQNEPNIAAWIAKRPVTNI